MKLDFYMENGGVNMKMRITKTFEIDEKIAPHIKKLKKCRNFLLHSGCQKLIA